MSTERSQESSNTYITKQFSNITIMIIIMIIIVCVCVFYLCYLRVFGSAAAIVDKSFTYIRAFMHTLLTWLLLTSVYCCYHANINDNNSNNNNISYVKNSEENRREWGKRRRWDRRKRVLSSSLSGLSGIDIPNDIL